MCSQVMFVSLAKKKRKMQFKDVQKGLRKVWLLWSCPSRTGNNSCKRATGKGSMAPDNIPLQLLCKNIQRHTSANLAPRFRKTVSQHMYIYIYLTGLRLLMSSNMHHCPIIYVFRIYQILICILERIPRIISNRSYNKK